MLGTATAIVAVVLAVTGPVVVIGAPRSTEPGALRIEPLPDSEFAGYYLPPDAPLAEMPLMPEKPTVECTTAMHDWLAEHGVKRPAYRMSVRNNADAGPMLTIDNVRVVDKERIAPRPGFTFECGDQGEPAETVVLTLDLDGDGQATSVDQEREIIRPFAFNLAPGEQGHIEIHMVSDVDGYSGRVVADVTGGGTTERIELPLGDFEYPGDGRSAGFSVAPTPTPGIFYCEDIRDMHQDDPDQDEPDQQPECNAEEVRSKVAEIWK
jgi:hypothetical protein